MKPRKMIPSLHVQGSLPGGHVVYSGSEPSIAAWARFHASSGVYMREVSRVTHDGIIYVVCETFAATQREREIVADELRALFTARKKAKEMLQSDDRVDSGHGRTMLAACAITYPSTWSSW